MSYKCSVCGVNEVEEPGGICELCALDQDPFFSSVAGENEKKKNNNKRRVIDITELEEEPYIPGRNRNKKNILLNGIPQATSYPVEAANPDHNNSVPVYSPGEVAHQSHNSFQSTVQTQQKKKHVSQKSMPMAKGIIKNISVTSEEMSFFSKLLGSLTKGIPYMFDDEIVMFQVFPDYSGNSLNAMGNVCDQVIVYGTIHSGAIADNNSVEVYGHRDSNNIIVAKSIKNMASGTTITPSRFLSPFAVYFFVLLIIAAVAYIVSVLGVNGIIWAIVILFCLSHIPLILKIIGGIFGFIFYIFRRKKK